MKLDAARIPAFLRDPGRVRIVLLHGDDEGLVRHRAGLLTQTVAGQRDDPFRVAWLGREDHSRLMEEATAIAMMGGRRVIRVRDASDGLSNAVRQAAETAGDSLVVLECGALPNRSKLRALVEGLETGASIACYPEESRALRTTIEGGLRSAGVSVATEAVDWLAEHLGSDHGSTRGEIDKLILYAGTDRRLDVEAVRACVGDLAVVSLEDALFAASSGDIGLADVSIDRALAEGTTAVAIVRGVLAHFGRLHAVRGHMASGSSVAEAIKTLRPPIFFKRSPDFARAAENWDSRHLLGVLQEASRVEMACKQTGAPDSLLVRRLISSLARQGAIIRSRK